MKTCWLTVLVLYAGCIPAADLSCTALIYDHDGSGDLYLGDDNGARFRRLTSDGRPKFGASLSPQGDKASFLYEKPDMKMQVVAADGDMRTFVLAGDAYQIATRPDVTQWDSEALVLVQFWGHANSMFEWLGVGETPVPPNVPKGATDPEFRMGTSCASAPQARHIACVEGTLISIDDRAGVFIDPFEEGRELGTFTVAERMKTPVPGYAGASFTVIAVRHDGTSFRAGFGDSQPEIFLPDGDGFVERIGASAWGEFRVVSHHERSRADAGGAAIAVRVLDVEDLPQLGALAWTDDGSTLAVVHLKPGSGSDLLIVRREQAGRWRISKRLAMSSDSSVDRLKFIGASMIYAHGTGTDSSVFAIRRDHLERLKSLPNNWRPSSRMKDSRALSVEDWSCMSR